MKSTSLTGGRCGEQGAKAGEENGVSAGMAVGEAVTPWAAGMYEKIKAFEIDRPGDAFPFSARLARENGWSRAYALRVVEEYRRFVCLMATAPHPVTPSEAVDQAWHLHMTYTRSYWNGLCKDVVGRPLHHDPTRGGRDETAKFTDCYARTIETYRRVFGQAPASDIWPSPKSRFAPSRMQWVDLAEYRLVRRDQRTGWRKRGWMWLGLASAATAGAGCAGGGVSGGQAVLIGVVVAIPLIAALVLIVRAAGSGRPSKRRHDTESNSSGCGSTGFFPFFGGSGDSDGGSHGHSGNGHGDAGGSDDGGHGCGGGSDGGDSGCSGGGCGGGGCGGGGD